MAGGCSVGGGSTTRTREITAEILQKRLEECVEKIDNEEALEFSMQQNKDGFKQDVFLNPVQ